MSGENPGREDAFSSTIATTNSNLSRLSKTVSSTASTLVSSQYGDLRNTHYQTAMNDIARKPGFQRRLFSFNRKTPSEMVKSAFDKKEIQYQAVTNIPEELLLNIPPAGESTQFSLFQGFEASASDLNEEDAHKLITDGTTGLTSRELQKDQEKIVHRLDLLEIRKDLAATEIREIDQRIQHLQGMRKIVFDRVAKLEQEEFELEKGLRHVLERLQDTEEDEEGDLSNTTASSESTAIAVKTHQNHLRCQESSIQRRHPLVFEIKDRKRISDDDGRLIKAGVKPCQPCNSSTHRAKKSVQWTPTLMQ